MQQQAHYFSRVKWRLNGSGAASALFLKRQVALESFRGSGSPSAMFLKRAAAMHLLWSGKCSVFQTARRSGVVHCVICQALMQRKMCRSNNWQCSRSAKGCRTSNCWCSCNSSWLQIMWKRKSACGRTEARKQAIDSLSMSLSLSLSP